MSDQSEPSATDVLGAARERRESLRTAMVQLESAIGAPAAGRLPDWRAGVTRALTVLERVFVAHVEATEGTGGLFQQVLERAPRLANTVTRLREDHSSINDSLRALADSPSPTSDAEREWVDGMRDGVLRLHGQVSDHRSRGADLLHEAYDVDIGGGA